MNQNMLLFLLLVTSYSQILNKSPIKLSDMAKNTAGLDPLQVKAINYLLQTHPELANYNVTILNTSINRTNQAYADNLKDYLFQLSSTVIRIRALVTLSDLTKQRYVTISPIFSAPPEPPKGKYGPINEYSFVSTPNRSVVVLASPIINQPISSNNKNNTTADINLTKKTLPNSFLLYQNYQDPLVQFALDYIASQHPNIINYNVTKNIYYQLVSGLNIKIEYIGYDNYSRVTAVVNFDLKLNPSMLSFNLECLNKDDKSCKVSQAMSIYQSTQTILMFHPELFTYRLINVKILQPMTTQNKMRVMLTFQNSTLKLRTLLQKEITANKVNLLSLYTYSYEQ